MKDRSVLTHRQRQVLKMLAEGKSIKEVAQRLKVSPKTVMTHKTNIMRKLNIHSMISLVHYAIRNGIAELQ